MMQQGNQIVHTIGHPPVKIFVFNPDTPTLVFLYLLVRHFNLDVLQERQTQTQHVLILFHFPVLTHIS